MYKYRYECNLTKKLVDTTVVQLSNSGEDKCIYSKFMSHCHTAAPIETTNIIQFMNAMESKRRKTPYWDQRYY